MLFIYSTNYRESIIYSSLHQGNVIGSVLILLYIYEYIDKTYSCVK